MYIVAVLRVQRFFDIDRAVCAIAFEVRAAEVHENCPAAFTGRAALAAGAAVDVKRAVFDGKLGCALGVRLLSAYFGGVIA